MAKQNQQPSAPPPKEGPRNFLVFLRKIGEGELERVCSGELFEMGNRLRDEAHLQGALVKGAITLTLNFVADPELDAVTATYEIKRKVPKPKRRAGHFWLTPDGNFASTPPKSPQTSLPFGDVANLRGIPNDLNDEEIDLED